MADSVGAMSVYRASDELIDPFCDPCFKDSRSLSVAGYCRNCVEFYCQSCLVAHRNAAISARHKILLGSDMPACQEDKPVKYQLCDKHNKDKDRYCFDHGITICGICVTRDHKHCQVKEVSEASKGFNISAEKKSLSADIDSLLNYVIETRQTIQLNNDRLEKKRQEILTVAKQQRDDFLEKVNQSYQDFREEVTNLFKDHITILSERQSALDKIVTEIDTILQSLQQITTKKLNDQQEFLELQYSAEKARVCEDKIKPLNLKQIDINCNLDTTIQPLILTKNMFGELSLQIATNQYSTELPSIHYPYMRPRLDPHKSGQVRSSTIRGHAVQSVKLTPLDKINVKILGDKEDCNIWGVDITADGNMLLTDTANCNVKLFSPDGILLSSLKTPIAPIDVTVIKKAEAVISMQQKQIGIIDIADSSHVSMTRIIKLDRFVWGITNCNSNPIIICCKTNDCPRSVQMIDINGKILWTATNDSEGKNLFDRARFLTTCSCGDGSSVIVTDRRKQTITVLDAGTGQLVKVCNVKGKAPCDVTVDDNGNVYVCYYSGEISLFSRGMQEETRLTTESTFLKNPFAMACNSRRSELVLTSEAYVPGTDYYDFIHRFKISSL